MVFWQVISEGWENENSDVMKIVMCENSDVPNML